MAIGPSVWVGSSRRSAAGTFGVSMYPKCAVTWKIPSLAWPRAIDFRPLGVRYARHRHSVDRHDHHVFVERVIVLDVGPHRQRSGLFSAVEEHRGARDSQQRRLTVGELVDELAQRSLRLLPRSGDDLTSALPGGHHGERDHGDQQRQPRPVDQLGHVRCQEHQIDQQQSAAADHDQPQRRPPPRAGDVEEQQRGDGDRAGHRHAERVRQRRRAAEREHQGEHRDQSTPLIHGT